VLLVVVAGSAVDRRDVAFAVLVARERRRPGMLGA
jgi:hypothetical protein